MAGNDPDERLVYLACQHIFRDSNSQVRKLKTVKGLIEQNKTALADILREYNVDRTSNVAKKLLENRVFDSTLEAKIRFPELFDVSPTQSAEREASEAEAARDEANTVQKISQRETTGEDAIVPRATHQRETDVETEVHPASLNSDRTPAVPSLYPVYIHYRGQHVVLTAIQRLLEEGCFEFAQQDFPQILKEHGWDCTEAVELTQWTKLFCRHSTRLKENLTRPLDEVISLLRELRHSAVHRLRKTAAGIERLAENAQIFLEALNDSLRSEKVMLLRREIRSTIEELKRSKDLLEGRLLVQLKEIRIKRSELDKWEKEAKETMVFEDLQNLRGIGEGLEKLVEELNSRHTADPKEPIEGKGKEKMMTVYQESLDSEEEFLGAVVQGNSSETD
ncbi:hypothetical protein DTO013E5_1705 [Penicillium roqueforti]|uniref:Genomic scaffold, ProqFM164S03 n=1 Tax=Penicillium roqueforti (strain FM164) TaxID=1365484 RepID=W6QBZ4_PENRF|nr:uncharacterized protein LCP9604111_2685 [Penicillium roqueforti]CDM33975.1 unnamed protein product [Penicillium roqueforti FM164]KAF9251284.1 hypothetical protein LCP9604111_2685 [Penicillium roqueforti]KAI2745593.1 hypothetical protein DTO012A1_2232 [Penicillium roqueforti]KAI2749893.1 hypothetical protein DTO013F2_5077 [Penicillium roqueforti]KAI2762849.1 hypothetical protein DTO012A8_9566 [Penicillium roqueforti]